MDKNYNIKLQKHRRTSLFLASQQEIGFPIMVSAKNRDSAKEIAQAIVRDYYNGNDYMAKQYKYIIEIAE